MKIGKAYACAALASFTCSTQVLAQEQVAPAAANAAVRHFTDPSLVYAGASDRSTPLVVHLPGTNGRSGTAPLSLLKTIRQQGYRVVFLTYNDDPAVVNVCPVRPPACSGRFRESRVFGGDGPPVGTPEAEAIAHRLADLLLYLRREHPDAGWGAYIDPTGHPIWQHIVLSGLSQGAGMAAYMAKRFPVERVVLFSSPWDVTGRDKRPAPWLYEPSATPPERWWAKRHLRENTTMLIAHAYDVLRIPPDHILLFDGGLPPGGSSGSNNPYHGSTVKLTRYAPQWRVMYGQPGH